jgi:hypothetical protein
MQELLKYRSHYTNWQDALSRPGVNGQVRVVVEPNLHTLDLEARREAEVRGGQVLGQVRRVSQMFGNFLQR